MTTPRIIWNGNILDFPYGASRWEPEDRPIRGVAQSINGQTYVALHRIMQQYRFVLEPHDSLQFFRDLEAWWNWCVKGNVFSIAFDPTDTIDTTINATTSVPAELVLNGNFDTWASDTDAGTWTETLGAGLGAINRIEDRRLGFSGAYAAQITNGTTNTVVDQNVTLATSTAYRLRVRCYHAIGSAREVVLRVRNTTTGNDLQLGGTWGATTYRIAVPQDGYSVIEVPFTTEASGTVFSIAVQLPTAGGTAFLNGEAMLLDWVSILPKQRVTLTTTDGIVAGNRYRLRCAPTSANQHVEVVKIDSVVSGTVVELNEPVKFAYAVADIFRSLDYFPAVEIPEDQRKQPFGETPGLTYDFDFVARNYVT